MSKPLTGRRVLAIFAAGFGIILAVNLTMAVLATRTFPGMVVENSYVASQNFNAGLEAGRAQQARGWKVTPEVKDKALLVTARTSAGAALKGAQVEALLTHPLGQVPPVRLALLPGPEGRYSATLPQGLWDMELTVQRGGERHWLRQRIEVG
ncbi:FixH family protein [Sandaracinobacteroides hominis]|uniref:FixH family protein n=1 Tax=Sandaracinobacteroides hominis TaxID=2780086 RepID=UPI0018F75782|nr:FixH family protein [Sandaracinobacteroides hominis]